MAKEGNGKPQIPLIGLLAVKNHLITKEDLQKAYTACKNQKDPSAAIKDYFISNKLVSQLNVERLQRAAKALALRQKEFKFGAIAIRKGFVNQSVLKLVLEEQQRDIKDKKKVRLIGDMLVEAGMLTQKQRDYILKLQKRVREQSDALTGNKKGETPSKDAGTKKHEDTKEAVKSEEKPVPEAQADTVKEVPEEIGLEPPEIIEGGLKLEVASDYMAAYLTKTKHFDTGITATQIKETLFEKGILLGVVGDDMIEGFIRSSGFKTKSFRVAKGVTPIDGKDAQVEFFFNTDYLKAGGMTKDGTIDFKDRGEVPHVEEGTVLAEKIPMVEARNGHNIYGDEIPTMPGKDVPFKYGKGAKMSEDGYKVLAAVKGFPKYAMSGHIFVHDVYTTEGDVDYETGHIQYDGNVDVKGRVKSGFKVIGNDVRAVELDGGIINAQGNVMIAGGINEGDIYAKGTVQAKFIHNSKVVCMGNVVVQKEVVDSEIECSGSLIIDNGKLISSEVTAKMGIKIRNVGTEMAGPSLIKVGHDAFMEKELEKNKEQIDQIKEQIKQVDNKKEELKQQNLELQKQITELAHVQDRSQLEVKDVQTQMTQLENDGSDPSKTAALKEKMDVLKANAAKAEQSLDACFDKSEEIEGILESEDKKIKSLEIKLADFQDERSNLIKWSKDNPGKSQAIVEGAIMPGTVIKGKHCEINISEMVRHAKVFEALMKSDDGQSLNIYEMQIGNI